LDGFSLLCSQPIDVTVKLEVSKPEPIYRERESDWTPHREQVPGGRETSIADAVPCGQVETPRLPEELLDRRALSLGR